MDTLNRSLVDFSFTESCITAEESLNQSCLPLVDVDLSKNDATESPAAPLDVLRSHLAALRTPLYGVAYSPRRRERIERRLKETMESEKGEEERRKNNILRAAAKTFDEDTVRCTPRRLKFKGGAKSRPFKRLVGTLKSTPRTPRRQSGVMQLLHAQCFKAMD